MTDEQWDNTAELPTKFNKYRRLKEKSEQQLSQSYSTTNNSVTESSPLNIKL